MSASTEKPAHRVFDMCVDHDNLGTDIFLNVNIPSFTDAISKPCVERKKGFGGAEREAFGFYLTTDCPGLDSPGLYYDVPPAMPIPKTPFTSLMSDPPGKQYRFPPRTLVSSMSKEARCADKRDMEANITCLRAPGRHHVEMPIGQPCVKYRAPKNTKFDKSARLSVLEYQARVMGRSEAPPCDRYNPNILEGPPLFSTLLQKQQLEKENFGDKHYMRPKWLRDKSFGTADRFPFHYPVPNDCSTAYPQHARQRVKQGAPVAVEPSRSMSKAKRRSSLTNHAVDDMPAPGAYEVPVDKPSTKNVKQGYSPALPGGRGAIVKRVLERKDQESGRVQFVLDMEDDDEAKVYHKKVQQLADAKKREGGVSDDERALFLADLLLLKGRVFDRKACAAYPSLPPPLPKPPQSTSLQSGR